MGTAGGSLRLWECRWGAGVPQRSWRGRGVSEAVGVQGVSLMP